MMNVANEELLLLCTVWNCCGVVLSYKLQSFKVFRHLGCSVVWALLLKHPMTDECTTWLCLLNQSHVCIKYCYVQISLHLWMHNNDTIRMAMRPLSLGWHIAHLDVKWLSVLACIPIRLHSLLLCLVISQVFACRRTRWITSAWQRMGTQASEAKATKGTTKSVWPSDGAPNSHARFRLWAERRCQKSTDLRLQLCVSSHIWSCVQRPSHDDRSPKILQFQICWRHHIYDKPPELI